MRFSSLALGLGLGLSFFACGRSGLQLNSVECGAGTELCDGVCVPAGTCDPGAGGSSGSAVSSAGGASGKKSSGAAGTSGKSTGGKPSVDCTDEVDDKFSMNTRYDGRMLDVKGKDKQYYVHTNWWFKYDGQTVDVDGLSYKFGNPGNIDANSNNPMGYPSFFIGTYAGHSPSGSNLPKAVSALTEIPTIMETNAKKIGDSDYNAAYDVWFTASSQPLPTNQFSPGTGGAYLMVWLFKPVDRQPRGSVIPANGDHKVPGLPGTWDVWIDRSNPPCISYVSNTDLEGLEFDLNNFIKDAVENEYGVTKDMYLSVIFGGFEVWGGNDGLELKKFCANVK